MSANLFGDFYHFSFPQPQYLGSKYKHLHFIRECLPANIKRVADAFAGSQSVSYFFKQNGYEVYTNDFLSFSHKIGQSLVENKCFRLDKNDIKILLQQKQNPTHFDECNICEAQESSPSKIRYEMGLNDIFLSYEKAQNNLKHLELVAGDKVEISQTKQGDIEMLQSGKCVGRLSQKFRDTLLDKIASGYTLQSSAAIKYVVKYFDKEREKMTTQALCEIILSRN